MGQMRGPQGKSFHGGDQIGCHLKQNPRFQPRFNGFGTLKFFVFKLRIIFGGNCCCCVLSTSVEQRNVWQSTAMRKNANANNFHNVFKDQMGQMRGPSWESFYGGNQLGCRLKQNPRFQPRFDGFGTLKFFLFQSGIIFGGNCCC